MCALHLRKLLSVTSSGPIALGIFFAFVTFPSGVRESGTSSLPAPLSRRLPAHDELPLVDSATCDHAGQSLIQGPAPRAVISEKYLVEDNDMQLPLDQEEKAMLQRTTLETATPAKLHGSHRQRQRSRENKTQYQRLGSFRPFPASNLTANGDALRPSIGGRGNRSGNDDSDAVVTQSGGWTLLALQVGRSNMFDHLVRKAGVLSSTDSLVVFFLVLVCVFICLFLMFRGDVFDDDDAADLRYCFELDAHNRRLVGACAPSPSVCSVPQLDSLRGAALARAQSPRAVVASPHLSAPTSGVSPAETSSFPTLATVTSLPPSQPTLIAGSLPPTSTTPQIPMLCEDLVVPPSSACTLLLPARFRADEVCAGASREVSVDNLESQGVFHAVFALDPALGDTRVLTLSCCEQRYASGETREIRYGVFASCRLYPARVGAGHNELPRKPPVATIHRQCEDTIFADVHLFDASSGTYQLSTRSCEMFFRTQGEDLHITDNAGKMLASVAADSALGRRTVTVLPFVDAGLVVLTALALDWLS